MTDAKKLAEALRDYKPSMDLVGPTVDDDIRRAIARYGPEAVKEAVMRQTKPKRGRKPEKDWPELHDVLRADAKSWLEGSDPFASRSNYSIAKDFADRNPGHNYAATMQRIERKLRSDRIWMTIATAHGVIWDGYPHAAHIRTLEAMEKLSAHPHWPKVLNRARRDIADYEAKYGCSPAQELSMKEIEDAVIRRVLPLNAMAEPTRLGGIFGSLSLNRNVK